MLSCLEPCDCITDACLRWRQQSAFSVPQGETGDYFYIIKAGEAVVYQETAEGSKKVNHLFKADYFGEQALLTSAPRWAGRARTALHHILCSMVTLRDCKQPQLHECNAVCPSAGAPRWRRSRT